MIDCGFPIISYPLGKTPEQWGQFHGESFRDGITQLVEIRTNLMRAMNPSLGKQQIDQLADEQWKFTQEFDVALTAELKGIAAGANITTTDLVVLNNYTDFRDIHVADQGCSLAYVNAGEGPVVGQTWDMHGSAKNYVCCIEIPVDGGGKTVAFSVVGCVGMMGFNSNSGMLGVNNINTDGAEPGVLWPVIVRSVLNKNSLAEMANCLTTSPKTSGHNYLIAVNDHAEMWEVAPGCNDRVDQKRPGETGFMFHTNHCLGQEMVKRESVIAQNSTTRIRFDLLAKKIPAVKSYDDMVELLNDHENYPKSICSNFQTDAQDPSVTCGGAVGSLDTGRVSMWRGDKLYDDNFVCHEFDVS